MHHFIAAQTGDLQGLRATLTADNVNNTYCEWTVLLWTVYKGRDDCVNYCIEMGANVNVLDGFRCIPLRFASLKGYVNIVRALLDAGAIVDVTDNDGFTPLYFAFHNERPDVVRLLIDRGAKVSNVKLGKLLPTIPDWITTLFESRSNCRFVSIAIIVIHKYRRTTVTGNHDINVLRLISKHIWSTRMDDAWVTTVANWCSMMGSTLGCDLLE
jgi:hypothetical protein